MQNNPFKRDPIKIDTNSRNADFKSKIVFKRTNKEKDWGKKKFTPVLRTQPATPWSTFKSELLQKRHEESSTKNNLNMDKNGAQQALKKREENYRRMLITEAQKEPTKWEDFTEPTVDTETKANYPNKKRSKLDKRKMVFERKSKLPIVDQSLLTNFDSKKLSFQQNNALRKIITKTTCLAQGTTLGAVVKDIKRRGLKIKRPKTQK